MINQPIGLRLRHDIRNFLGEIEITYKSPVFVVGGAKTTFYEYTSKSVGRVRILCLVKKYRVTSCLLTGCPAPTVGLDQEATIRNVAVSSTE